MLAYRSLCYKIYESRFTVIFPFAPPTLQLLRGVVDVGQNNGCLYGIKLPVFLSLTQQQFLQQRVYLYWKETEICFVETMFVNKYMYVQI